ncbi:uncharacterized protein BDR25DRAFT_355869 [Lindgomyces ingoldianus]|uniref:Uncharacterized protein n=1 Tax=Lindgomyces ingoldianus TaxID=673940 RepID=A0ACB6QT42_9PLEO|nr:uncharacterized protein BDR25DRAFT_355869 [Lindgomyces ingoldianus]KAF2470159.1 hypothetical protein BDR25DRAFT_355869 [Lindgomyces ingoldianus]
MSGVIYDRDLHPVDILLSTSKKKEGILLDWLQDYCIHCTCNHTSPSFLTPRSSEKHALYHDPCSLHPTSSKLPTQTLHPNVKIRTEHKVIVCGTFIENALLSSDSEAVVQTADLFRKEVRTGSLCFAFFTAAFSLRTVGSDAVKDIGDTTGLVASEIEFCSKVQPQQTQSRFTSSLQFELIRVRPEQVGGPPYFHFTAVNMIQDPDASFEKEIQVLKRLEHIRELQNTSQNISYSSNPKSRLQKEYNISYKRLDALSAISALSRVFDEPSQEFDVKQLTYSFYYSTNSGNAPRFLKNSFLYSTDLPLRITIMSMNTTPRLQMSDIHLRVIRLITFRLVLPFASIEVKDKPKSANKTFPRNQSAVVTHTKRSAAWMIKALARFNGCISCPYSFRRTRRRAMNCFMYPIIPLLKAAAQSAYFLAHSLKVSKLRGLSTCPCPPHPKIAVGPKGRDSPCLKLIEFHIAFGYRKPVIKKAEVNKTTKDIQATKDLKNDIRLFQIVYTNLDSVSFGEKAAQLPSQCLLCSGVGWYG